MINKIKVISAVVASILSFQTDALELILNRPFDSDAYNEFFDKASTKNVDEVNKLCGTVRKSAMRGDAVAQYILASEAYHIYCEHKCYFGCSQTPDIKEDLSWLRRSAENGYAVAQCELGHQYEEGDNLPQDINEAEKWYMKAAMHGYAYAQDQLGGIYSCEYGHLCSNGKRDIDKAVFWYKKACENGYYNACSSYKTSKSQADRDKELHEKWENSLKGRRRNCVKNGHVVPCDSL